MDPNSIFIFFKLLWAPDSITPQEPFKQRSGKLGIGALGCIGFAMQLVLVVPSDFISTDLSNEVDALISAAAAVIVGTLVIMLMFAFENGLLLLFKIKGAAPVVLGSQASWTLLPFVTLLLRGLLPQGMTAAGHGWITWVLGMLFICWHPALLTMLVKQGHVVAKEGTVNEGKLIAIFTIITSLEVIAFLAFVIYVPMLLDSSLLEVLIDWRL
ncbi:MAG: hypothetical protein ACFFCS_13275 [Candidatus Hodarchaeota archaeon]